MKKIFLGYLRQKCHSELVSESQNHEMLSSADRLATAHCVARARFVKQVQHDKQGAFTLAEVLITLTIIGVIAALTIPNLMRRWEDAHTVSAVKEAYAILDNAFKMAISEHGPMEEWEWPSTADWSQANLDFIVKQVSPYLKTQKVCYTTTPYYPKSCLGSYYGLARWDAGSTTGLNGGRNADFILDGWNSTAPSAMVLQNGMIIRIGSSYYWINANNGYPPFYGGSIFIDINGGKKPNRWGYDLFAFSYANGKIEFIKNKSWCDRTQSRYVNSLACAYYIMKHGNVDYKYRDVSAEW